MVRKHLNIKVEAKVEKIINVVEKSIQTVFTQLRYLGQPNEEVKTSKVEKPTEDKIN